jgi:hypothetical protein
MYESASNARRLNKEGTLILVDVVRDGVNLTIVAAADDAVPHGKQLYDDLVAGKYGKVAAWIKPKPTEKTKLVRPETPADGQCHFDRELCQPLWWAESKSRWVDAMGNPN